MDNVPRSVNQVLDEWQTLAFSAYEWYEKVGRVVVGLVNSGTFFTAFTYFMLWMPVGNLLWIPVAKNKDSKQLQVEMFWLTKVDKAATVYSYLFITAAQ